MAIERPDDALAREADVLARYLLDVDCPPDLAARYAEAVRLRTSHTRHRPPSVRVAQFAIRNPWSLPYISAAAPFFRDGALLRAKLTLLAAVLETTPRFAREFLPRELALPSLAWVLVSQSVVAAARAALGAPLLLIARFAR